MSIIDQLKKVSNDCIKSWIDEHIMYNNELLPYAIDHVLKNGKTEYKRITYSDFFNSIEKEIMDNNITFEFNGCGIKGPYNLYIFICKQIDINTTTDEFVNDLTLNIVNYVSNHPYLVKMYNQYSSQNKNMNIKLLLGMYYLAYLENNKNDIYDLILEYKIKSLNQCLDL
jgi:hypothetical protein